MSRDRNSIVGRVIAALLPALAISAFAGNVAAQGPPPTYAQLVRDGERLAIRLCQGCHVVAGASDAAASAGIPTMRGIANRPDQTAERIRNTLINPHPPMPDVMVSFPEIDRLIAYIDSLRADSSGPPLVPRNQDRSKPVYPDPT